MSTIRIITILCAEEQDSRVPVTAIEQTRRADGVIIRLMFVPVYGRTCSQETFPQQKFVRYVQIPEMQCSRFGGLICREQESTRLPPSFSISTLAETCRPYDAME